MNLIIDFLPIAIFFTFYKLSNIYSATIAIMVTYIILVVYHKLKTGKYNKSHLIALATVIVLGGATVIFKNEMFIKWKATVVYWILALTFIGSKFFSQKTLLEHFLASHTSKAQTATAKSIKDATTVATDVAATNQHNLFANLPATVWQRLNYSWTVFFVLMGIVNLYIAYNCDTNTWVNFKLFGALGLTTVFVVAQTIYLARAAKA